LGVQENINRWFGGVVEVSGTYLTNRILLGQSGGVDVTLRTRLHSYTFMAGPQLTFRSSSTFQSFVRALLALQGVILKCPKPFQSSWSIDATTTARFSSASLSSPASRVRFAALAVGGPAWLERSVNK